MIHLTDESDLLQQSIDTNIYQNSKIMPNMQYIVFL